MALMRCKIHTPKGRTRTYVGAVESFAYPETALICGSSACKEPALIWLDQNERDSYDAGERIFSLPTAAAKVRAQ